MASSMIMRCCTLLASLLLVLLVGCHVAKTSTVQPYERPNEGLVPYVLRLPATISRALDRIRRSTQNYRLMNDIWFQVIPENAGIDRQKSASKSPPGNLVEQADAVFDTHRLTWQNAIVQGLDLNIYKNHMQQYTFDITKQTKDANKNSRNPAGTRTFGMQRRRMQLVMLPVMYKLGVITTLLIGLTVLSVKGVTIGVLLLVLAVASVAAKLSKHHNHYVPYSAAASSPWIVHEDPYDRASQHRSPQAPHEKNIHVHVHTAPGGSASPNHYHNVVSKNSFAYDSQAQPQLEDNVNGPYYWNRNTEDYYDAAAFNNNNNYNHNNRRIGNSDEESTTISAYRWLG